MTGTALVLVTGMAGAGKSTAIRALEDAGYFCIDNLPVVLLPRLIELARSGEGIAPRLALVVDAREKNFLSQAPQVIEAVRGAGHPLSILFLDAADEALIRRFSETRRRHPLAPRGTVPEGIALERKVLAPLRALADEVADTSHLSVHELKEFVQSRYGGEAQHGLVVNVVSFGYRHGLPPQADVVLDVRFLPNPYFVPELKGLPGTDPRVAGWVLAHPETQEFLTRAGGLLLFLLPRYLAEGKSYLTVAVGCTGGRHRSVALAEALAQRFGAAASQVRVRHRDVEKE